jgi:high frequency lysogenization protein
MNPMEDLTDYRSLSLGGIMLAAELVHSCARGIPQNQAAAQAVKRAITSQHAESMREVFPTIADFEPGVASAINALRGKPERPEVLRYALQLIELASLLGKSDDARQRLGSSLDSLPQQPTDTELAGVYQSSISTLGKRIQITGNPDLLQQTAIANEIRALLLGGVRFAWLWQQLGGRRWQLILQRKAALRSLGALHTVLKSTIH